MLLSVFQSNFFRYPEEKPESQDDWKAAVWSYSGPKPSHIESVEIKPSDDSKYMCIMWNLKNG